MTIRAKVLLFSALAIGLAGVLGGVFFRDSQRGGQVREQMVVEQEQLNTYARIRADAWPYLEALARARQAGMDTAPLLREQQQRTERDLAALEALLPREQQEAGGERARKQREQLTRLRRAWLAWAAGAEALVRSEPTGAPLALAVKGRLYEQFEHDVGQRLTAATEAKLLELSALRQEWARGVEAGQGLGGAIPLLSLGVVLALAASILVPLRRSLRELLSGTERIGRGDFTLELPEQSRDELGALARALNQMARELQKILQEKQAQLRAEASEHEALRYNTLLEQTLQTHSSELEAANARLADSLQQLQATQARLHFADRLVSVGQLAAGVGHEINNPLAYILSNLTFVRHELARLINNIPADEGQEMLSALDEAREGAERVRLIVTDLKSLSRPDDTQSGPVDLCAVVKSALRMAAHEIRKHARLVEDCHGVPPVWGNGPRLGQVFLNLLINAAQAIPEGQTEGHEVRVTARPGEPGHVAVEVSDTGCGIPPENLQRIFDPFFTTKPIGVGTGLGLAVCHSIISSFGGSIHVESKVGRGTTFRVVLRTAQGSEPHVDAA